MSVCGLDETVVGACWVGVIKVWRESRFKGLAGIGEDNNNSNTITFIGVIQNRRHRHGQKKT